MSDATQVVEDVVECRIGLLTCLANQHVYDTAQLTPAKVSNKNHVFFFVGLFWVLLPQ